MAVIGGWLPDIAVGHEIRPGYLNIRETTADTFAVTWKVPSQFGMRLGLFLRFDDDVNLVAEPVTASRDGAHTQWLTIQRGGGLAGTTITIDGLDRTITDVFLQFEGRDGTRITHRLTPDEPIFLMPANQGRTGVFASYLGLGIDHILFGVDHLLFVLTLLLIVASWRMLIATITAFTVGHSITLAFAALGLVRIPGPPVEAIIALSIVIVATEIVRNRAGRTGLVARLPWIVTIAFGLLHGFGFAGALAEIGLPSAAIPLALLAFNVGIEAGQLLFVGIVLALYALLRRFRPLTLEQARIPVAYGIGGIASFWVIERVATFWT